MTQAHWYSNFCPYFSVTDLDEYLKYFTDTTPVSEKKLRDLGKLKAAQWLKNSESDWLGFLAQVSGWEARSRSGEYHISYWGRGFYPRRLVNLSYPPPLLFIKGEIGALEQASASLVGSRNPTHLGRLWVEHVVPDLVRAGVSIVSGGARGIDSEAHWEAVRCGGVSLAFLPGGVDRPYPSSNSEMFIQILKKGGALISEFPPGSPVRPENFYRRNRLIAGSGDVVVVIEAGLKSGTLITARSAVNENNDLLVVPGPPMVASYAGSLELLGEGAGLARYSQDILKVVARKNVLIKTEESPTVRS